MKDVDSYYDNDNCDYSDTNGDGTLDDKNNIVIRMLDSMKMDYRCRCS